MSLFVRSMAARGARRIAGLCLVPLVTACGAISHNIAENMTESNRLEMLQGMNDDQLCRAYNNHLVGPKTERQLLDLLRAKGISKCEARGRTRGIPTETVAVAAVPQSDVGVHSGRKAEDEAALELERQRVWDEAKKKEQARVAAEAQSIADAKNQEEEKVREADAAKSAADASAKGLEDRNRKLLRKASNAERTQISRAVQGGMLDPQSAMFGEIYVIPNRKACAAVNGKNRMGGYAGFQSSMLANVGGNWQTLMTLDISMLECISVILKMK